VGAAELTPRGHGERSFHHLDQATRERELVDDRPARGEITQTA
jgi:hypothetical protein